MFHLLSLEFELRARGIIAFPQAKPGNALRGGFGAALKRIAPPEVYAGIFAPSRAGGPSGLADPPRPFVFRVRSLDGRTIQPGEIFRFGANLFNRADVDWFIRGVAELANEGLGPTRGKAEVIRIDRREVSFSFEPVLADSARVEFLTPTELKSRDLIAGRPEFPILFARIRDRISTLSALYGAGPLPVDFAAMGERAKGVRITGCEIRRVEAERRSARSGQSHPIGGFTGWAGYEGPLGEFVPYLNAAQWTGVGRQTVWGKGEIRVSVRPRAH